jgi:LacI family transcriptional regulator
VEKVARDLGFERRTVRRHRARAILSIRLVLPRHRAPERGLFFDFSQLVAGLNEGLQPSASNIICDTGGPDYDPFPHKKGGDTDAFVFAFHEPSSKVLRELKLRGVPAVVLNRTVPCVPCVVSDHAKGMQDLVERVLATNSDLKPAFVSIEGLGEVHEARLNGWIESLKSHGFRPNPEKQVIRFPGIDHLDSKAVMKLAKSFNALFCVNDIVAAAVLSELGRSGIRVPLQCQVTGFDDSPVRKLTRPLLTSVSMPVHDLARVAGKQLASAIIESVEPQPLIRLAGKLVLGDSTLPSLS